jgi:hypothetical protein
MQQSPPSTRKFVDRLVREGRATVIEDSVPVPKDPDWPYVKRERSLAAQLSAVVNRVRHRAQWLAFLFPNEFLWVRNGHSLFDELKNLARRPISVVFLGSYEFGGRREEEDGAGGEVSKWLVTQQFNYRSASPRQRGARPVLFTHRIGASDIVSAFRDSHPHFPRPNSGFFDLVRFHANAYLCVEDVRKNECKDATGRYHRANLILDDTMSYTGLRLRAVMESSLFADAENQA